MKVILPLLFLLCISLPLPNQQVVAQQNFDSSQFLTQIIQKLQDYAIYTNGTLDGWLNRVNGTNYYSDLVYNGYTVGVAGIGDFLINAYKAGNDNALQLIQDAVNHFAETGVTDNQNRTYWERFSTLDSDPWTGNRYGSAGILNFLGHAYQLGIPNATESLLDNGVKWLMSTQDPYGYWPIQEDSYVTTGIDYGAAGMASALLNLYKITSNPDYLNYSITIADYLAGLATFDDPYVQIPWTPAVDDPDFLGQRFSGIAVGEAGIMDFYYQLYNTTHETKYLDISIGLAEDLINIDLGGYWPEGTVDYLDPCPNYNDKGDATALIGFRVGATGTSYELLQLYQNHGNSDYLNSALQTAEFVAPFLLADGSVSAGLYLDEYQFTGLSLGAAGVANYFVELYKYNSNAMYYAYAERILSHLYQLMVQYGLVPFDELDLKEGFSFSYDEGLAGIGNSLLNFMSVEAPAIPYSFPNSTHTSSTSTSPQNSESTLRATPYNVYMSLLAIPVLILVKKSIKIHNL